MATDVADRAVRSDESVGPTDRCGRAKNKRRSRAMLKAVAVTFGLALLASSCVTSEQTTVSNQVNSSRTTRGVRAMGSNAWMSDFAQQWAKFMAANCTLGHSRNYASANPYNWRGLAENVGRGSSLTSVHNGFMNSTDHRTNILNGDYNYLGTGVATGCGQYWVVHEFMAY